MKVFRRQDTSVTPAQAEARYEERPIQRLFKAERLLAVSSVALSALVLLPVITIVALALMPGPGVWAHLFRTVLPVSVMQTLLLLTGVGLLTLLTGACTAWLVTMYRFPGRRLFDGLLILPLALPT